MEEDKLNKPIFVDEWNTETDTFREYSRMIQWPERTYVEIDIETANIATDAINKHGLDILSVCSKLEENKDGSINYRYDDIGMEYIQMASPKDAKEIISKMVEEKDSAHTLSRKPIEERMHAAKEQADRTTSHNKSSKAKDIER